MYNIVIFEYINDIQNIVVESFETSEFATTRLQQMYINSIIIKYDMLKEINLLPENMVNYEYDLINICKQIPYDIEEKKYILVIQKYKCAYFNIKNNKYYCYISENKNNKIKLNNYNLEDLYRLFKIKKYRAVGRCPINNLKIGDFININNAIVEVQYISTPILDLNTYKHSSYVKGQNVNTKEIVEKKFIYSGNYNDYPVKYSYE